MAKKREREGERQDNGFSHLSLDFPALHHIYYVLPLIKSVSALRLKLHLYKM